MPAPIPIPESRILELKQLVKSKWEGQELRRFLCVWLRVEQGLSAKEIAHIIGWHPNTVSTTQRDFIFYGKEVFLDIKGDRGRPRIMSPETERAILEAFEAAAKKGTIIIAQEIKVAIEEKLGHKIHKATLYRILKRNKWRKIVPRPKHPKQNKEAVEAFKKGASQKG